MPPASQSETLKQHYSFGFFGIVCSLSISLSLSQLCLSVWGKLAIFIISFVLFILKNIFVVFFNPFGAEFDQLVRKIWKHQTTLTALASRSTAQPIREGCYETFCLFLRIRDPPILHGWLAAESRSATGTVLLSVCLLLLPHIIRQNERCMQSTESRDTALGQIFPLPIVRSNISMWLR